MEPYALTKQAGTAFRFPNPALSPFTLPAISHVVRSEFAQTFMLDEGHTVDFQGHSAFCLEAYKGGFLEDSDLKLLDLYSNGYGLHLVTTEAVNRAASKISFELSASVPTAKLLERSLGRKSVEITYASRIALACAEAGLLHDSVLTPIIELGMDCGYDLIHAAHESLDNLFPHAERLHPYMDRSGKPNDYEVFFTAIEGDDLCIVANGLSQINLQLPQLEGDFVEVNILLCKTLDAMSRYLVPFHTPASSLGVSGQYMWSLSEVYDSLKDHAETKTRDEMIQYLTELDYDNVDFEVEFLGLDPSWGDGPDPETIERAADLLLEAADIELNYSYRLDCSVGSSHDSRKAEMVELRSQAKEVILKNTAHSDLLEVLVTALTTCIDHVDTHFDIHNLELNSSEDEGVTTFECLWVGISGKHQCLIDEAETSFNAYAQECADVYIGLPITSAKLVAQVTAPIMTRTQQCFALLRSIQRSLESTPNA